MNNGSKFIVVYSHDTFVKSSLFQSTVCYLLLTFWSRSHSLRLLLFLFLFGRPLFWIYHLLFVLSAIFSDYEQMPIDFNGNLQWQNEWNFVSLFNIPTKLFLFTFILSSYPFLCTLRKFDGHIIDPSISPLLRVSRATKFPLIHKHICTEAPFAIIARKVL